MATDVGDVRIDLHTTNVIFEKGPDGEVTNSKLDVTPDCPIAYAPALSPPGRTEDANDAGARLLLPNPTKWDMQTLTHTSGLLRIVPSVIYRDTRQTKSICPDKPGIYLVKPVRTEKGCLRRIV